MSFVLFISMFNRLTLVFLSFYCRFQMASYFRKQDPTSDEYTPGSKFLLALTGAVGVWGLGSIVYKYFSRSGKPISQPKTAAVLNEIVAHWGGALRQMAAQEQQLASRPGMSREQMQMIAMYLQAQLQDAFATSEEQILTTHRVTKRQMKEACALYASDQDIATKVYQLKEFIKSVNPPQEDLPADMTLERAITIIKSVLDLTVSVMEEVFKALGGENLPKSVVVSPEFLQQLNSNYAKVFVARRTQLYEENDLTEELISRITEVYSDTNEFREMLAKHQNDKRTVYNRMGLMLPM
jgi:hypothetical protein